MLSPFPARASTVYVMAAAPVANAKAADPPSRAAILLSNTDCVGFVSLPYMLPGSERLNLASAWAVSLKTYDVVRYIGTARESVVGSGCSWPTWSCSVSNLYPLLLPGPSGTLLFFIISSLLVSYFLFLIALIIRTSASTGICPRCLQRSLPRSFLRTRSWRPP